MRLYLDVETYRPRKQDSFVNERVIAIGVVEDWTPYRPDSANVWERPSVVFRFFTIWEISGASIDDAERKLITVFYNYLGGLVNDYRAGRIRFLNLVGFNILRYDIPLLIQKGAEAGLAPVAELNKLWHDVFVVDYFQAALPLHGMRFKDLKLELLADWARKAGVSVPEPYGHGRDIAQWYERGQYQNIIKHLRRDLEIIRVIDLNFEKLHGTKINKPAMLRAEHA